MICLLWDNTAKHLLFPDKSMHMSTQPKTEERAQLTFRADKM